MAYMRAIHEAVVIFILITAVGGAVVGFGLV